MQGTSLPMRGGVAGYKLQWIVDQPEAGIDTVFTFVTHIDVCLLAS